MVTGSEAGRGEKYVHTPRIRTFNVPIEEESVPHVEITHTAKNIPCNPLTHYQSRRVVFTKSAVAE